MNAGTLMRRLLAGAGAIALGLTGALAASNTAAADGADVGNIDFARKGSITVTKYAQPETAATTHDGKKLTDVPTSATLKGVEFTVRKVEMDLTDNANWDSVPKLNAYVSGDTVTDGAKTFNLGTAAKKSTDAKGEAKFADLQVGVYLVQETSIGSNAITNKAAPFYVTIPLPQTSGEWLYDVFVYPKNSVTSIKKEVDEQAALGLGSTVSWPITVTVPHLTEGSSLTELTITDELDQRLEYTGVTVTPDTLKPDTDFTATESNGTVKVVFTETGRKALEDHQGKDVVVTVHTKVNAIGDGTIKNDALVTVNDYTATTNEPFTKWGAIKVLKVAALEDGSTTPQTPLQGAEFQVFTSEADAVAGTNPVKVVVDDEDVTTFISNEEGDIVIPGLLVNQNGERVYWLKETKAPSGYLLLEKPISVTVKAGSITDAATHTIENVQRTAILLPLTGGAGTAMFSVAGLTLMATAVAVVVASRRRAARQA